MKWNLPDDAEVGDYQLQWECEMFTEIAAYHHFENDSLPPTPRESTDGKSDSDDQESDDEPEVMLF